MDRVAVGSRLLERLLGVVFVPAGLVKFVFYGWELVAFYDAQRGISAQAYVVGAFMFVELRAVAGAGVVQVVRGVVERLLQPHVAVPQQVRELEVRRLRLAGEQDVDE